MLLELKKETVQDTQICIRHILTTPLVMLRKQAIFHGSSTIVDIYTTAPWNIIWSYGNNEDAKQIRTLRSTKEGKFIMTGQRPQCSRETEQPYKRKDP
ncbi:hypothetical protein JTB14_000446 [Gonioctena quinquepunctata]|nr:hypothetical protein JTB14_000446 [Gonioctena quinquepunctata]